MVYNIQQKKLGQKYVRSGNQRSEIDSLGKFSDFNQDKSKLLSMAKECMLNIGKQMVW